MKRSLMGCPFKGIVVLIGLGLVGCSSDLDKSIAYEKKMSAEYAGCTKDELITIQGKPCEIIPDTTGPQIWIYPGCRWYFNTEGRCYKYEAASEDSVWEVAARQKTWEVMRARQEKGEEEVIKAQRELKEIRRIAELRQAVRNFTFTAGADWLYQNFTPERLKDEEWAEEQRQKIREKIGEEGVEEFNRDLVAARGMLQIIEYQEVP